MKQPNEKPLWAYLIVIFTGIMAIPSGGMVLFMAPFMPLIMAGFATDDVSTPMYIPMMIFFFGYAIIIPFYYYLIKAIGILLRRDYPQPSIYPTSTQTVEKKELVAPTPTEEVKEVVEEPASADTAETAKEDNDSK